MPVEYLRRYNNNLQRHAQPPPSYEDRPWLNCPDRVTAKSGSEYGICRGGGVAFRDVYARRIVVCA